MKIINIMFSFICFVGIMFAPTTQQQILLSTASIANLIALEVTNIIEHIKEEKK